MIHRHRWERTPWKPVKVGDGPDEGKVVVRRGTCTYKCSRRNCGAESQPMTAYQVIDGAKDDLPRWGW